MRRIRHAIFGSPMTDRRDIKREKQISVFTDEFMIEVPLDVDVSALTGTRFSGKFKVARPQDFDDRDTMGVVL